MYVILPAVLHIRFRAVFLIKLIKIVAKELFVREKMKNVENLFF
jgi:hypothetical protein